MGEKETPHEKAENIKKSIICAFDALFIAKTHVKEKDPDIYEFLYSYLPMKVADYYNRKQENSRLYT